MSRPTGFADLAGQRVGVFGYGLEGHAAFKRLRNVARSLVVVDDEDLGVDVLKTDQGGFDALATCDVVLKSPGIPRRRDDVVELERRGVVVTSALNLWLGETERARVVAVTGTKGKSTTTTVIEFLFQSLGERALRLGNIGAVPYDPNVDTSAGWLVLEVSSFQSVDLSLAPALVVVTSLGEDHLDWHGSVEQYHEDKLALTRASGEHVSILADTPALRGASAMIGGDVRWVRENERELAQHLGLIGAHSESNVALGVAAVVLASGRSSDEVRAAGLAHATRFEPLPGRLTLVREVETAAGTFRFIDDGLATAPLPTLAALEALRDAPLALIAGGFDRGVDYRELAHALDARVPETHVVVTGPAGNRLAGLLEDPRRAHAVDDLEQAVRTAVRLLGAGGVVLLSPAAPSFDRYRNWEERSRDFTRAIDEVIEEWSLGGDSNS
ncbi:MAG TPA: UDP-N-acetylmuramoyl-L-alanine--D-glutamate ligase [Acidimicrobiales bacterium]|nr:UDP-N-acetylmuramoyl-L-alanine--D-glutamate ligase [Acidimicrobiales bacterium]